MADRSGDAQKSPAGGPGFETTRVTEQPPQCSRPDVQTSSRPRRCPWFADVLRLSANPAPERSAWRWTAVIFAGSRAWDAAAPIRAAGRRACTLLPPGTDPAAVIWPRVSDWIGDAGDLPTEQALELARCLIDSGAARVQLIGQYIRPAVVMEVAA